MVIPEKVLELVERFDRYRDDYRSGKYNETQLRREFIDPFFEALGWDVSNKDGYAEAYKDVIHEDAIKIGGATKAPDYCFRIGGTRKFFLEAKKPSVNIREDTSPAFQLRRYAWSAKLPLSILTDFEELAIYDCRIKPVKTDKASTARIQYYKYNEFAERWDEIASVFSREAVLKGSFDTYAESTKAKRGTAEVDDAFLNEIESWRDALARNLALRNSDLSQRDLNFAVQRTIDRIIFLRICEDRGVEKYGQLLRLQNEADVYERLYALFERADEKYNSGLFHFHKEKGRAESPDELTPNLIIDDKPLKEIIRSLYYPDSPYEFSVLPADILGQVYEQFLGKVIRLTAGHRAVVEDKPEVKKAGGVYYTPTYIVDYIVKQTVGKLCENKKPKEVAKLRILDPACGSGSFLIGAYQYLLDWHRDWYVADGPENHKKELYQGPGGEWRLVTGERKRILLGNIYGVDIDPQAVEVTKLSLLLKVLEGESAQTLDSQLRLFRERALPDLDSNIKCGNSLISPDFYDTPQMSFLDEEDLYRINAFDWQAEFPEIIQSGGFDAVIGNPPYVFGGNYGIDDIAKVYFKNKYFSGSGKINLFTLFIERSIQKLRHGGLMSFIIPNTFLRVTSYANAREFVLKESAIRKIVDLGAGVFAGATTSSVIMVLEKQKNAVTNQVEVQIGLGALPRLVGQKDFIRGSYILNIRTSESENILLVKLESLSTPLGYLCDELIFGVVITKNRDDVVTDTKRLGYKRFLEGKDIGRYYIRPTQKYLCYEPRLLHRPRTPRIFEASEKLLIQRITGGKRPLNVAYDNEQYYNKESINNLILKKGIGYNIKYILGLLNSTLLNWFYNTRFTNQSNLTVNLSKEYLSQIPIRIINISNQTDKALHDRMIELVQRMLLLHNKLGEVKTSHDRTSIQRQIEATDRQIDRLVYELYDLTDDEIKIVEDTIQ